MARYKIYAAEKADVNQGWVWLGHRDLVPRSIVKLYVIDSQKCVYCEVLTIDDNFLSSRRIAEPESALVAAEWYRKLLGIEKNTEVEIEITPANFWWGEIRACLDHPQIVIRLAVKLALWSVALGIIGVIFGVVGVVLGVMSLCN